MRRLITAFIILISAFIFTASANAANGDIAGTVYTTDILTQFNGKDIPSYAIDGETLIALEDLADYGFSVYYDDSIRTVFVNEIYESPDDFNPQVERGKVGAKAGYYYESNISAIVNGIYIQAYAIDGKMVAKVEELGEVGEYSLYSPYGMSNYLMTYTWNEQDRLLSLFSKKASLPSVDELKNNFINSDSFSWFYEKELTTDSGSVLVGGQSGTPHGTYKTHVFLRNSDKFYIQLDQIIMQYRFQDMWGHRLISNLRTEGNKLIFDGQKNDGRWGTYSLDLLTSRLDIVGLEYGPDPDKITMNDPKIGHNPISRAITTMDFDIEIDGVRVQAYQGKGIYKPNEDITFIDADVLTFLGYSKTVYRDRVMYTKTGEPQKGFKDNIIKYTKEAAKCEATGDFVMVNGHKIYAARGNGKLFISPDDLLEIRYGLGTDVYEFSCKYGLSEYMFVGGYDAEANKLLLLSGSAPFSELKEAVNNAIEYETEPLCDTDDIYVVKAIGDVGFSAPCYLVKGKDGYAKVFDITTVFIFNGVNFISNFEFDGENIIATNDSGRHALNINTFEITQM